MPDNRIILRLSGGIGNQMFQYATARALAKRSDGELVLDSWSGFVRDRVYKRSYELSKLPVRARLARPLERLPFWTNQLHEKLLKRSATAPLFGPFLHETEQRFMPELVDGAHPTPVWMTGYWQSPRYFAGAEGEIASELTPPTPDQGQFRSLGKRMQSGHSVAIGVRLYEESATPEAHSNNGTVKTPDEINGAISELASQVPDAQFYVFCTHLSKTLKALDFPTRPMYVTPEAGFDGAIENLWLLSQCRHHIFTNSTFYWWGAWLSERASTGDDPFIFAADNFINDDGLPDHWRRF